MIILTIIAFLLVALYLYGSRTHKYWLERGIKHEKPLPFIGNSLVFFLRKQSSTQAATELYWKYPNEDVVGFYRTTRPELVIRNPEIAKRILTTDFIHFYERGLNKDKHAVEPILRNLFFAYGDLWRLLRQRMTPAFSSGKLKAMFPLVCERAEKLQEVLAAETVSGAGTLDARDIMARYTTDFIGSCGFGLEADSLSDKDSAFRKLGAHIFKMSFTRSIKIILRELVPEFFKHLTLMEDVEVEIVAIVREILKQRNNQPSGRNDFIDLLLECKKKGTIVGESIEKSKPDGTPEIATLELDVHVIAAQVFVFFAAGFETSSSATSYTLHQLAFHQDEQKKVQDEIDRVLAKHENKLSYDAIKEMTYLEWAFQEGMRMFPSLGYLMRECSRKYTFKDLDLTIDPGVGVVIPLQALHNDPEYFDNPEVFRPGRFHPDEMDAQKKLVYQPFGEGPRACIGARLGLMQSMAGLAAVLSKYTVEPAPETLRWPVVEPTSHVVQSIRGGLPLIFRERQKI